MSKQVKWNKVIRNLWLAFRSVLPKRAANNIGKQGEDLGPPPVFLICKRQVPRGLERAAVSGGTRSLKRLRWG